MVPGPHDQARVQLGDIETQRAGIARAPAEQTGQGAALGFAKPVQREDAAIAAAPIPAAQPRPQRGQRSAAQETFQPVIRAAHLTDASAAASSAAPAT